MRAVRDAHDRDDVLDCPGIAQVAEDHSLAREGAALDRERRETMRQTGLAHPRWPEQGDQGRALVHKDPQTFQALGSPEEGRALLSRRLRSGVHRLILRAAEVNDKGPLPWTGSEGLSSRRSGATP